MFDTVMTAARGTDFHALAHHLIRLKTMLPRRRSTLNMYVNDCILWRLDPEVMLVYSALCFGTADALAFRNDILRISDLKMGVHKASVEQLEIYAALFCLEYNIPPGTIRIELRIYQNDEKHEWLADPEVIAHIMDRIKYAERRYAEKQKEALS